MMIDVKRVTIFTGNLGSGKTEIAINLARNLSARGEKVSLVDLDIINPYFRTRIAKDCLTREGLNVVCPPPQLANSDLPAIGPGIKGAIQYTEALCVCDVGGDDVGAIALGMFKPYLPPENYELLFVVNTCRPFTRDAAGVRKILAGIELNSRLKVTALVSNPNLGRATDLATVLNGHRQVEEIARALALPVKFLAVRRELFDQVGQAGLTVPLLMVDFYMQTPWEKAFQEE